MESKYYTPTREEFYMNFEYEYFQDDKWHTEGFATYVPMMVENVFFKLKNDKIRVKYLDESDIKELGFYCADASRNLFKKDKDEVALIFKYLHANHIYNENGDSIVNIDIQKTFWKESYFGDKYKEYTSVFSGYIKNKNELKIILTQMGINYEL